MMWIANVKYKYRAKAWKEGDSEASVCRMVSALIIASKQKSMYSI